MYLQQAASGKNWKIATIRGHAIRVAPWFLVLVGLFVFMRLNSAEDFLYQLMWAPVLFFSILLHELGHAAASKKCGFGTSTIILHGFGGVAINRRSHTRPKQGMFISLAGPAVTLVLALGSLAAYMGYGAVTGGESLTVLGHFLRLMIFANFFWFVINMLPIYPMDGGQTTMYFLRKKNSQGKALETTAKISLVTLAIAAVATLFLFSGGIFLFFIFAMFAYMNWQVLQQARGGGGGGGPGVVRFRR